MGSAQSFFNDIGGAFDTAGDYLIGRQYISYVSPPPPRAQ